MPFPSKAAPALATIAVGSKVFVKDPELAQQYPADVLTIVGDTVTVALYQGNDMKRPADAATDVVVDVTKAAAPLVPLIGLPVLGYGATAVVASAPAPAAATTTPVPAATAPADGKVTFPDVTTFHIPGFDGLGRAGQVLHTVNGKPARDVLNFDGSVTGLVAEVNNPTLTAMAIDKAYTDRVVSMIQYWSDQVAKGALPGIGETVATTAATADAPGETVAEGAKRRGRRTNAEIAEAKKAELAAAGGTVPAPVATAAVATTPVAGIPQELLEAVTIVSLRAFWKNLKATAEAELAKLG